MNQRDIAKLAGVSSATISRVINKDPRVSKDTFERVSEVINKYGYVENAVAKNLRMSRTKTIGYLMSDIGNPFFPAVLGGIESVCHKKGYDIIFGSTEESIIKEKKAIDTFLRLRVDGLIAVFADGEDNDIKRIEKMDIPLVLVDRKTNIINKCDYVGIDNVGGMILLVKYLIELGHKKISVIHGPQTITPGSERLEGFRVAMKNAGLKVNEKYVVNGCFTEEGGYKCTKKLLSLDDTPTAIIVSNNLMSMGAYKALIDMKIRIPEQISIAGFDDFNFASHLIPPMTVISRPTWEMGKLAAEFLLEKINNNDSSKQVNELVLPTKLCIRKSCAPV